MPQVAPPQSIPALLAALCLGLIFGCQKDDNAFHVYKESAPGAAPVAAAPTDPTSGSGIVPASAQTSKPLPEVAHNVTQKPFPTTGEATSVVGPASIGAALPSESVLPLDPPTNPPPATSEQTLSIPPAPPAAAALAPETTPLPARQLELLIPEKTFNVEGSGGALRVSFDDVDLLKVLNADPVPLDVEQHLPAWLSGLHGKTVRIRGWMFPPPVESGLPAFMFVRDNKDCCFGRKVLIYDKIGIRLRSGETTDYIEGHPFDVEGQMVIKTRIQDGELFLLYVIEDAVVFDK